MHYINAFGAGWADFGSFAAIGVVLLGTVLGVFVGAIPGLGGIVLLVVLLPFLYNMSPVIGLGLLLAAHSAIYYAGSTTAILINTPGAPESAATCLDGYPMAQRGEAGRALGISAAATTFGGWFGAIVMVAAIPVMLRLVDVFHPPEYFLLAILAIVVIGQLQAGSVTKGLLSGGLGYLFAFVGAAASTGSLRYTFGYLGLYSGINLAAAAIGLFAISQMYILFAENTAVSKSERVGMSREVRAQVIVGIRDVTSRPWLTLRSSIIGVLSGVVPGIGSTAANFLSYGQAMQTSKHPELFGTGIPEGIIAPEASSISKEAGSLIPTVALGLPNGPAMAVVLAALSILGLQAGPPLLQQHLSLVFWMVIVLAVSSLLASVIGLTLAPVLGKVVQIPGRTLVPFVICLASLGAFESTGIYLQVYLMILMGGLGVIMRRFGYSLPAVIVGLVLGSIGENNLVLTSTIYGWRFLERPLSDFLIALIILVIIAGVRHRRRQQLAEAVREAETAEGRIMTEADRAEMRRRPTPPRTRGELIFDVIWVAGSAAYVIEGTRFAVPANLAPTVIGGGVLIVGVIQLFGGFHPRFRRFTVGIPERAIMSTATGRAKIGASAHLREAVEELELEEIQRSQGTLGIGEPVGQSASLSATALSATALSVESNYSGSGPSDEDPLALGGERHLGHGEDEQHRENVLLWIAFLGALVLTAFIGVFGYEIVDPVFVFAYLLLMRRWSLRNSLIAGLVMFGIAYGGVSILHLGAPPGFKF